MSKRVFYKSVARSRTVSCGLLSFAFFALFLANLQAQGPNEPSQNTQSLTLNQPIEKTISQNKIDTYSFTLEAGQFVQILVRQKGIDLRLGLFDKTDQRLSERNSRDVLTNVERISFIAKASEGYQLKVRAEEGGPKLTGKYEIELISLRPSKPEDEFLVAAENVLMEGNRFADRPEEESHRKAIEKYKESFDLFLKAGDKTNAYRLFQDIAQQHIALGEWKEGLTVFERALPLQREIKDLSGEAVTLRRICRFHLITGEKQAALNACSEALKVQRETAQRNQQAASLYELIGTLYSSLGDERAALDNFQQGYLISQESAARYNEVRILNRIGEMHFGSERYQEALSYFQKALQTQKDYFGNIRVRTTILFLGRAYTKLGQPETALSYLNQALEIERDYNGLFNLSAILTSVGEIYLQIGDKQKALEHLQKALSIKQSVSSSSGEAEVRYWIARVERSQNNMVAALSEIEKSIQLTESVRAEIIEPDLRASYFARVEPYYDFYLDLLWQLHKQQSNAGYDVKALGASERFRARGLAELLRENQANIRQSAPLDLLERERELQKRINLQAEAQINLLNRKHKPEQAKAINEKLQETLIAYSEVQTQIRIASPRYASLVQPQALTLPEIQASLDANTLLLEYKLGVNRSFLWAITKTGFAAYELPKRAEIETQARRVYELLTARNKFTENETGTEWQARLTKAESEYKEAAASLSQTLLAPIASQLKDQRLLIVSDGALQYIPFGVLPVANNEQLLVTNHEIASLPSASVIAVLRSEFANRPTPKKAIAIFADPVFTKEDIRLSTKKEGQTPAEQKRLRDFGTPSGIRSFLPDDETKQNKREEISRLPFSRREANEIQKIAQPAETFVALDFNANRAKAMSSELAQYRIVHFATHGWLDSQHPKLSGLVLSLINERGESQDGFLRLHEIYNLDLNADLVVLSACQTGLGKEVRGEGLVGLTRGFMYAGAARVAASLWKVDDVATAELMKHFYHFMLKEKRSAPAALRAAQLEMMKQRRWSSAYYWSGFVIQGEWL